MTILKKSAVLASAWALAACAAGPDFQRPAVPAAATGPFVTADTAVFDASVPVNDRWWRLYDDPVLDGLIRDALNHNSDVRAAVARMERARAALREAKADLLPDADLSLGATRGKAAGQTDPVSNFRGGLGISYELDLFGRFSRNIEVAGSGASKADLEAVRVLVAAETASAYADAANAAERIAVAERIVQLLDQSLALTRRRVEIGEASRLDSARIAALRHQRQAELPTLAAARDAALFRLATLTGRTPSDLPPAARTRHVSLHLARPIPVGDGAGLIARRPDVRAAERRLAAATAKIGVAAADLYPRITLGGNAATAAGQMGNLFTNPVGWLLGPLINWSFGDRARAKARVAGAEAGADEALANFDGAVLRALEETETALSAYANLLRRQAALEAAREEAAVAARIVRARQREGDVSSLDLIDAERTSAEAEAALAAVKGDVASAQIDLFRALGGGWDGSGA